MIPNATKPDISNAEAKKRILKIKNELGEKICLLAHHYQRDEIVQLCDFRADSLELARIGAQQKKAKYIVFCGVTFMAESAAILASPNQVVVHPDKTAGCPMADMVSLEAAEEAWQQLIKVLGKNMPTPVTYVNSSAKVKAFCGRNGGITCTSANAQKIISGVLSRTDKFFFFPDEHLGRNSSRELGISPKKIILWNPELPLGGNTPDKIKNATAILWKGYCHVHTFFTLKHIKQAREKYKGCKIVVHPECEEKVVKASDVSGSTGFIIKYVKNAPKGSTTIVGTEINLVSRLAKENPSKKVYELARSLCPNMYKINLQNLAFSMENLGKINVVKIDKETKKHARIPLKRMLDIS